MTVTQSQGRSFIVGLIFIGVAAIAAWVALTANQGRPLSTSTTVKAAFTDIGQLQPGDEVRENSKRIGQVSHVEFGEGEAIVTMSLRGRRDVYADATAAMWDQSALGQKFVELEPGSAEAGPLGSAPIPTSRTVAAMDIDQVLDVLDPRTRAATSSTLRELGTGAAGQSVALHEFLKNAPEELADLRTVARALSSRQADLPALLDEARDLSRHLNARSADLESLTTSAATTLRAVGVDRAVPLSESLQDLPDALRDVRTMSSRLNQPLADVHTAVTALRPGVQELGASTPAVRSLLRNGVKPLKKVPKVAKQATPAVDTLTTTLAAAEPVAPRVQTLLSGLNPFIRDLRPYSVDIPALAKGGASFTNMPVRDSAGEMVYNHVLIFPVITGGTALGLLPQGYNPYPAPGTAIYDGKGMTSPIPGILGADR